MDNLVVSNMLHRPARTVVTILGISVGVLLILFTIGLANGSVRERAQRETNVGAEIFLRASGSIGLGGSEAFRLDEDLGGRIVSNAEGKGIEGVAEAVPFGQTNVAAETSTGSRIIEGVEFAAYAKMARIRIMEGREFDVTRDEVIIDTGFQRQNSYKIGDTILIWGRPFTIVGTYAPAAGGRVKMALGRMQDQLESKGKVSTFLVKVHNGQSPDAVAERLSERVEGVQVILTKDLEELYLTSVPALNVFLNVVIGVAAIISALVILMTMYTTVTERTRQIGIMKSLGMGNSAIAWTLTKEALLLSFLGVVGGVAMTFALREILTRATTMEIEIRLEIVGTTLLVGLVGGVIGAIYPALRAARLDAVDALSYE
jgi:putative ABC transport system permease protein